MTKHIYFSGIGGTGLFPLAQIALDLGYKVSGSDLESSAHTQWLRQHGVDVHIGQDTQKISRTHAKHPINWLVGTSALPTAHPELAFASQQNIKASKRDEFVNELLTEKNLRLVAVSGTHGKTTVTGMLIWLFNNTGKPASYAVGSDIAFGFSGHYQPGSQYFIYEADEFDRNFLAFQPYLSIIPTIEYDHSDTYPKPSDYKAAFIKFISQSHCVFLNKSAADYLGLKERACLHETNPSAEEIKQVKLAGEHNRRNGLLAVEAAKSVLEIDDQLLLTALNKFPGTGRRMEKLGDNLYSDYAHLPAEIQATLQLARELSDSVVIVYQPHQNIRQHEIKEQYRDCFKAAKKVYWLPTYLSREYKELPVLEAQEITKHLEDPGKAELADLNDQLADKISQHRQAGDLVVLMGAGSIDGWARKQFNS